MAARQTRPLLGLLLLVCATVLPVSADELVGNRVRVTTSRLDLVFSVDGASPVAWRACHPSCAQVDAGQGTSLRFTGGDDLPATNDHRAVVQR